MPYGPKRTPEEILEFQEKIITLLSQGFTDSEIISAVDGLNRSLFYRVVKKVRAEAKKRMWGDANRIITNYVERTERRIARAEKKSRHKIDGNDSKWLSVAQRGDDALFDRSQSMGIIPKAAEKQEITHDGMISVQRVLEISRSVKDKKDKKSKKKSSKKVKKAT